MILRLYTQARQAWLEHFSSAWAREAVKQMNQAIRERREMRERMERLLKGGGAHVGS